MIASGIKKIDTFETDDLPCKIAGQIPIRSNDIEGGLNINDWIETKDLRRIDRFIAYGLIAAQMAIEDSKWVPSNLNDNDLVIGSRYIEGVSVVNWPIRRLILSYGANLYSRIITGMPINDGTGGFKAWSSSLLSKIKLEKVRSQGYSFQIEMNFRAWRLNARIKEVPIIFVDRTIGESKMSSTIMYEAIWMVWRLRIWKLFGWI